MPGHEVAAVEDLPPGERVVVEVDGRSVGVFNVDGEFYALPNVCPHQYGPLCEGSLRGALVSDESTGFEPELRHEGEVLACPWHGLEFHVPTGECLSLERDLPTLPVSVEDGTVVLEDRH